MAHLPATLLGMHCLPVHAEGAMVSAEVSEQLRHLPEWHLQEGAIARTFAFDDYWQTMAFLNALAYIVHREDHHPDITFGYNTALVRFNTHSVKGISVNDFICAAKCDALYDARPMRP